MYHSGDDDHHAPAGRASDVILYSTKMGAMPCQPHGQRLRSAIDDAYLV